MFKFFINQTALKAKQDNKKEPNEKGTIIMA